MSVSENLSECLEGYRIAIEERLREVATTWKAGGRPEPEGEPARRVANEDTGEASGDPGRVALDTLASAMIYALEGGKRLRGAIVLAFCDALGGRAGDALPFAAAIEMVHAYSLVHDDLPCMDDDDFRRGKLSCHKQFGYATALLCGDALLTAAFEVAASAAATGGESVGPVGGRGPRLDPGAVARCIALLADAAGPGGMVGGQVIDLDLEGKKAGPAVVGEMYRMKTGALFEAAAAMGAVLAGTSDDAVHAAATWGLTFGYAFQIVDDLDDLEQSAKEQGKDTLAGETSADSARRQAAAALKEGLASLEALGGGPRLARQLSSAYLEKCGEGSRAGVRTSE